MDQSVKNKLLKRTLGEYIDRVLDPLEDQLTTEFANAYEALGLDSNDPVYFRGKLSGLKVAFDALKQIQNNFYNEDEET